MRGPQPSSSKYDYSIPPEQRWRLWFAWYPVYVKGEWHWLCDMMRRGWTEYRYPTIKDQQEAIDEFRH
jgi:hypothetical protein